MHDSDTSTTPIMLDEEFNGHSNHNDDIDNNNNNPDERGDDNDNDDGLIEEYGEPPVFTHPDSLSRLIPKPSGNMVRLACAAKGK